MAAAIVLALCCLVIFLLTLVLIFAFPFSFLGTKKPLPWNCPILGMLLGLVANYGDLLGYGTLLANQPGFTTFLFKGPWFSKQDLLIIVDPANVRYMCSTRFSNFPRGPKGSEIFDVFGDGYFNLEGHEWAAHRKIHRSFFGHKQFNEFSNGLMFKKMEKDMTVVFEHLSGGGRLGGGERGVVDLEDLFSRFTYDLTHRLVIGNDPRSLSMEWPQVPFGKAMNNAMQSVWMRHLFPGPIWKLQRHLGLGHEKVLKKAKHFLNKFSATAVSSKHDEFETRSSKIEQNENFNDILIAYLIGDEHYRSKKGDEVLKGSLLSLMLAGKDSNASALTWFFWNLSQQPSIEAKIRAEIAGILSREDREKPHVFTLEDVSKLVYLHAAVCETLRLHPPFPFQTRAPHEPDTLPSGHMVTPNSPIIVVPLYIMARVEAVWGKDCAEFKPERWIADDGGIKYEPSYKFFVFSSGPRNCLGRDLAMTEIKAAVATIVHNYDVEVLKKQKVVPLYSAVLRTKYGLQARITKRFA